MLNAGIGVFLDDKHGGTTGSYMLIDGVNVIIASGSLASSNLTRKAGSVLFLESVGEISNSYFEQWMHHYNHSALQRLCTVK